ncbi:MBL fold metallo-hydrolase [Exilibacterium tricleocarpae]|uniref:MBL fold metallo-hydrolase n=1 Tax=Exilibacterium tricleocarpae TaxID=2591008 RepID=A0A545SYV0_9GAMM|nr:MBL fold metallo-hydrolase [Exilibacterium tricleocarpae]TQV70142.1 MBL fold metallo-hydrolase [Exilibacterium tricleocarpae]
MVKPILITLAAALVLAVAWSADQWRQRPDLNHYREYFAPHRDGAAAAPPGAQLEVTYFGTSTLLISDGETALMTDGFFTRPDLGTLLFAGLAPDRQLITRALRQAGITSLAAVIPVHSHHDHAMDAPEVARQTGALLVGSESTANIGRGWGLPEHQIRVPRSGEPLRFGRFTVTLLVSKHAPMPRLIARISGHGKSIEQPLQHPAALGDYKEGGSFAVVIEHPEGNLLVQGSAGYVPGLLQGIQADTVFLGIGGLSKQSAAYREAYYRETVAAVGASRVIPIHWDDFTLPYSTPLQPMNLLINDFTVEMDFILGAAESVAGTQVIILPRWGSSLLL